ncbi:unnamed protein product, partial [Linum tenue]
MSIRRSCHPSRFVLSLQRLSNPKMSWVTRLSRSRCLSLRNQSPVRPAPYSLSNGEVFHSHPGSNSME